MADIPSADKLWHTLAFAVWAGMVAAGWWLPTWMVIASMALVGAMIELIQPLIGRAAELADWNADVAGAILGVWIVRWLLPRCSTYWRAKRWRLIWLHARPGTR